MCNFFYVFQTTILIPPTGILSIIIDEISVYSEKNTKVGTGAYVGDYLVPYNGSIVITYHAVYSYDGSTRISKKKTDRYQVGVQVSKCILWCTAIGGIVTTKSLLNYILT